MEETLRRQLLLSRAINKVAESISVQDDPDLILEDTVRIIGAALGVDRALIYDISFDKHQAMGLCEYLDPQYPDITPTKATYPLSLFIGGTTEMWRTRQYLASRNDDINPHLREDGSGEVLHHQMMIQSLLWYPFAFRENGYYLLVLNQIHYRREWTAEEFDFLDSVSQQVSAALVKKAFLIKERKQAEELRKFSQAVEQSPNIIVITDLDANVEYANATFVTATGYGPVEVIGKNLRLLQSGKTSQATYDEMWTHLTRGESWRGEFINKHKDGTEHINSAHIAPMRQGDGRITHYLAIMEDITERKLAEKQLTTLIEAIPDSIFLKDGEGRWLVTNEPAKQMFKVHNLPWRGKTEMELADLQPAFRAAHEGCLVGDEKAWQAGQLLVGEERFTGEDGRCVIIETRKVPMFGNEGQRKEMVVIGRDITERRETEEELRALKNNLEILVTERTAQLEAANKELEAFSYSVSHDLRTPLRAIDGFSRILLDDYTDKLDDEGRRLLNVVRDNTSRMGQLIDDILKFSRAGRVEINFSGIDMEMLAREVLEELRPATVGHEVLVEIGHLPPSMGDRAMMRQVFVNLLSNAIKFSRARETAMIGVEGSVEGDETIYHVKDNGAGFDMQYVDKLFGVFQRLHGVNEFEGTGIGLAIVKRIVSRHGGRVWAEGKVDEGATVYFALPAKEKEHE
ncbi:PAS domain S-box protein [Ferrovum sp.]|uniref:PAS domain S-box protein n=1 Tax=Ferrovum sp. TaxID=2609467 RepID=UPI00262D3361|nr:PAS domain S-box protein [Ferrovum sp.]